MSGKTHNSTSTSSLSLPTSCDELQQSQKTVRPGQGFPPGCSVFNPPWLSPTVAPHRPLRTSDRNSSRPATISPARQPASHHSSRDEIKINCNPRHHFAGNYARLICHNLIKWSKAKRQIYFLISALLQYKLIIIISKDSSHKRYKINLVK